MPEGPEVTLMTEELNSEFDDCLLQNLTVKIKKPKQLALFKKKLPLKIKKISNKGKLVFMELDKGWALTIQPRMTGHFWTPEVSNVFRTMEGYVYHPKHNHIEFKTTCGSFFLNDPRKFAVLEIYSPQQKELFGAKLASLGPDVLQELPHLSQKEFDSLLGEYSGKKKIGYLLLDQSFLAGIGNYLRAEILHEAKLSPYRTIASLSEKNKQKLKKAIQTISRNSYRCQKSKGIHKFTFKVYRNPKVTSEKMGGRTIWWNPKHQL